MSTPINSMPDNNRVKLPTVIAQRVFAEIPHDASCHYRQTYAKRSHAGIVFTQWSKNGFATQGRHIARINLKFGMSIFPQIFNGP